MRYKALKKIKRALAILLALASVICCAGCGATATDASNVIPDSTGGTDVTRSAGVDDVFSLNCNVNYSFNPLIATNHSNQLVCSLVYENMIEMDDNFVTYDNILCNGACNEDGTAWTFEIASGHSFHDGTPVTGKDLRYSLERAINADRFRGRFAAYQGSNYDDGNFYVNLGIGDTQFDRLLTIPVIPAGSIDDKRPLGSGPYMYNEDQTALIPYEGYPSETAHPLDIIYLKQYADAESIISAFEDGIIDAVTNDPSSYTNLGYASTNETHAFATTNYHYVVVNQESVLGKYDSFRQAMTYAFDRNYFVEELMHDNAAASSVPMYPTCADYPSEFADSIDYDLETCRTVLENAGIKDYDDDGLLEYMSGSAQDIEIVFIVCSDSSAKTGVVRRFQDDMASIGLTIDVQELTWDNYLLALEEGEFDMYYGEVKLRNNFDITELVDVDSELNFSRSRDTQCVNYVNEYLGASDMTRATVFKTLCEYLYTTGSLISIGFEKQQLIVHRGVIKNLETNMSNPLFHFMNWEITLK